MLIQAILGLLKHVQTPRGHLKAAGSGIMGHMGRRWRVYLCLPLVSNSTGFGGMSHCAPQRAGGPRRSVAVLIIVLLSRNSHFEQAGYKKKIQHAGGR